MRLETGEVLQKHDIPEAYFGEGCAVDGKGNLSCWGDNGDGQLGNSLAVASNNYSVAFTVMTGVAHVSVSLFTTCIVDATEHVQCWGANQQGVLGHDPSTDPLSGCPGSGGPCNPNPSTIMTTGTVPFGPAQTISVGFGYACSLKTDGTLWRSGQGGSVGNGAGDDAGLLFSPVQVTLP